MNIIIKWKSKINKNVERDIDNTIKLENIGYKVIRIWEHEINDDINTVISKILKEIN